MGITEVSFSSLQQIAAGMKAELDVEIYSIAVGVEGETGVGSIRHDLEIVTETDVLFLPIHANILFVLSLCSHFIDMSEV